MRTIDIKENRFDRAVRAVAPRIAVKRRKARLKLAATDSYVGASKTRRGLRSYNTTSNDADADLLYEREDLIDRSRDLERNNTIAGGAIGTTCLSAVGGGLRPHPAIDYKYLGMSEDQKDEWEAQAKREFLLWGESPLCDIELTQNFFEKQGLVLRRALGDGDILSLLPRVKRNNPMYPYSLRLQMIEADRVCNKKRKSNGDYEDHRLYDGIEKNKSGAPVRYHICRQHPNAYRADRNLEWDIIDAYSKETGLRNVLHHFDMLRPGQSRGVPWLAPVIELLKTVSTLTEAELTASVITSFLTVLIESEIGEEEKDFIDGTGNGKDGGDDLELGSGTILDLNPGEKPTIVDPTRPNSAYDPFVTSIFKQIGIGLGIPYEVLMKCFQSSYSASKASLLEAWRFFKGRRQWLVNSFCNPTYEIWMYEAVALGRIYAPGFFTNPLIRKAYLRVKWGGPSAGHIEPVKEANAVKIRTEMKMTTMEQEYFEAYGEDYDMTMPRIKKEDAFKKDMEGTANEAD